MLDNSEKLKPNQPSSNHKKSSSDDWQEINDLLDYAERIKNKCEELSDRIFLLDTIQLLVIVSTIIFSGMVLTKIFGVRLSINNIYVLFLYFWGLLLFLFIESSSRVLKIRISTDKKRLDSITELLRENSSLLSKNWSQLERIQLKIKLSSFDINTSISPWSKLKKSFSGDFLLWVVGVDANILALINLKSETTKYKNLGFVILSTSLWFFVSGYYISYISTGSEGVSIFLGIIWSIVISNIYRLIMVNTSIDSPKTSKFNFLTIGVRLILIVLIASTVSVPLELAIFKPEIESQITKSNQSAFLDITQKDNKIQRIDDQIMSVSDDIFAANQNIKKLEERYYLEISGKSSNNSRGVGVVAQALRKNLENQLELISKAEKSKYMLEKERADRVIALEKIHQDTVNSSGLVTRIDALYQLRQQNSTIRWATILINTIIVAIEIIPIVARNDILYEKKRKKAEMLISKQDEDTQRDLNKKESDNEDDLSQEIRQDLISKRL